MLDALKYRPGDWVVVKSLPEILATLDRDGRLEGMPFMPEMIQFCGKRFQVGATAHKTCDTVKDYVGRRLEKTVHLEGLRCDGAAHAGCQAACLLFWRHEWIMSEAQSAPSQSLATKTAVCTEAGLTRAVHAVGSPPKHDDSLWSCQATELLGYTRPLRSWDPRQYLLDVVTGNVSLGRWIKYLGLSWYNAFMRLRWPWRQHPFVAGQVKGKTPTESLDLNPGEWVQVRSKAEIMQTIGTNSKNRGLWFDVEMLPHCEKRFKVLQRVERIVDEKTGRLLTLPGVCVMLDGTTCSGNYSHNRLFCPRAIHSYWREIWLRRVD